MSEGPPQKEDPVLDAPKEQQTRSGVTYSLVTKYWPRVAAGLVVVIGLVEFVVGGLTADTGLEFYLMAWAGTTGALWFLFERAERSLAGESRERVSAWLVSSRRSEVLDSLPSHFAGMFDRLFGERHWSRQCFNRSCVVSYTAVLIVFGLKLSVGSWASDPDSIRFGGLVLLGAILLWALLIFVVIILKSRLWQSVIGLIAVMVLFGPGVLDLLQKLGVLDLGLSLTGLSATMGAGTFLFTFSMLLNFFPDYVSLLETRWAIRWMERSGWFLRLVVADFVVTAAISLLFLGAVYWLLGDPFFGPDTESMWFVRAVVWPPYASLTADSGPEIFLAFLQISFYSAFFTSVWLWIYILAVFVSRILLRMNSGIGFLLRVTDVEKQPFRSMGFVSVLITTGLFLLGLPFVLL